MSEQVHEHSDPRQELIALLQMDFTSPDTEALAQEAAIEGDALGSFLAKTRSVEGIEARLTSPENAQLGLAVEKLLAPAPVTTSFKGFIANEVRQAHAWESKVSDAVAPDRLGLLSGDGIFDPTQAKDIEAQILRDYLFDVIGRHVRVADSEEAAEERGVPPIVIHRPSDYTESLARLQEWGADYKNTYGEDIFASIDHRAFIDTVSQFHVMTEEEAEEGGWNDLFERLQELRDRGDSDQR